MEFQVYVTMNGVLMTKILSK